MERSLSRLCQGLPAQEQPTRTRPLDLANSLAIPGRLGTCSGTSRPGDFAGDGIQVDAKLPGKGGQGQMEVEGRQQRAFRDHRIDTGAGGGNLGQLFLGQ